MPYFNLVIHRKPKDASFWFDYEDAVDFEETEFDSVESANEAIIELCVLSGTDGEDNYNSHRPKAMPRESFLELYSEESLIDRFW